jgi:drug/metabolite transporter (DMT)-like permease
MHRLKLVLALGIVYFVWGSTYIAIRIGVAEMPWALMAGTRFVVAGLVLLGLLAVLRRPVRASRRDLAVLAGAGILLLGLGTGFVFLAETSVPAGLAALVVATTPLWVAVLEMFTPGGERLTAGGWFGLALGLVGLGVLLGPELLAERAQAINAWGVAALVTAAIAWALGTLLLRRRPVQLDSFASTGYQMLFGGLFNLSLGLLLRQAWPATYSPALLGSLAYLIVFGSLITLSAFTWLTRQLAPAKLVTHAYVNPIVAVLLGVLLLHERLNASMLAGMGIILTALVIVSRARLSRAPAASAVKASSAAAGVPEPAAD